VSIRTTYFGPLVSFRTTSGAPGPSIILDARPASFLPKVDTPGSLTSATLLDFELAAESSVTSAVLKLRSGATTYTFIAANAAVL
jgi:hypothetical protein